MHDYLNPNSVTHPSTMPEAENLPRVSVLVAARNEALELPACLVRLTSLQYPPDQLEIWVGNDGSDDRTAEVLQAWAFHFPQVRVLEITDTLPQLQGKANVLAQLAQVATGEWLAFTDADTRVTKEWLRVLLAKGQEEAVGVVVGQTLPHAGGVPSWQPLEWAVAHLHIGWLMQRGVPITAMGNNLLVRRAAYDSVGGYAQLPFSVTEDVALFHAVVAKGWQFRVANSPEAQAITRPTESWGEWWQQRRRWLNGVKYLPYWVQGSLFFHALLLPISVVLAHWFPWPVLAFTLLRWGWMGGLAWRACRQFGLSPTAHTMLWGIWQDCIHLAVWVSLPFKVRWKGRGY